MPQNAIKGALERVPELTGRVYPAVVRLDANSAPCAVYAFGERKPFRVMSGRVLHYTDVVRVDFLAETVDECHALYSSAEAELLGLLRTQVGGVYVMDVASVESDDYDAPELELGLIRRTMEVTLTWRYSPQEGGG